MSRPKESHATIDSTELGPITTRDKPPINFGGEHSAHCLYDTGKPRGAANRAPPDGRSPLLRRRSGVLPPACPSPARVPLRLSCRDNHCKKNHEKATERPLQTVERQAQIIVAEDVLVSVLHDGQPDVISRRAARVINKVCFVEGCEDANRADSRRDHIESREYHHGCENHPGWQLNNPPPRTCLKRWNRGRASSSQISL